MADEEVTETTETTEEAPAMDPEVEKHEDEVAAERVARSADLGVPGAAHAVPEIANAKYPDAAAAGAAAVETGTVEVPAELENPAEETTETTEEEEPPLTTEPVNPTPSPEPETVEATTVEETTPQQ